MVDESWLATVRIARDCGNISSLFPPGITRLWDLPHPLFTAIRMALYFLSFDNVTDPKDRPPKKLWLRPDKLEAWWREVDAAHKANAKGEGDFRAMPENKVMQEIFPGATFVG